MVARTYSYPHFVNASEKTAYDHLVRQLPDGAIVLANFRLNGPDKDYEADLIALMPDSGIVVIEVKGSHVWHDDGGWHINRDGVAQHIDPLEQALTAKYAIRNYVTSDPRWPKKTVRWQHHVVLTRTTLDPNFSAPNCPTWQITGASDLSQLGQRIWDTTSLHKTDAAIPTKDDIELIAEILQGRFLPARDVTAIAQDRAERAQRLTLEQAKLLEVTRLLNRIEVRGGAGSGKTVMAIQQAKDLASGRWGQRQRVAVLCYSYGLAHTLSQSLLTGQRKKQPAFVGTFEQLGSSWGIPMKGRDDSEFWERELPALMAARAAELSDGQKFDAIIVDEAQDFADTWWDAVMGCLRDEDHSGLFCYTDERQEIFSRSGRPPIALVPLVLDHCLRNTQQIAKTFAPLAPKMDLRGDTGPDVTFVDCSVENAIGVADDQVDALFAEGWQANDIALITMGRRHPVQLERQENLGYAGYWEEFASGDDIFYSHVAGFKGLERRAVVLCVNLGTAIDRERAERLLYVGLSRATDRLIVVGDESMVRTIGGPEVASQLGLT